MARPSLCLLLVVGGLCASALDAPAAEAEQPLPVALTDTNPTSTSSFPANSTTPLVMGRGDGSIATTIRPGRRGAGPIRADVNPKNEVAIYTTPTCTGTPTATGILEELEGAGIQVEVLSDSTTTFYATQTDAAPPGETSECPSRGLTYYESSTVVTPPGGGTPGGEPPSQTGAAPPPAPHLHTVPGGRANDNTPLVVGSAPGAGSVRVFATPNCAGAVVAKGSPDELAAGLKVQVADNSFNSFSAFSLAGGNQSACSSPVIYVEDSAAPRTRITMGPGVKTRRRKAVFRFADITEDPPGTTFLCKVNHGKWGQCSSPLRLGHLRVRRYVVRVKAIDSVGNAEAKGAKRRFKVIR